MHLIRYINSKNFQNPFQKYPAINDDFRKGPFPQNAKHYPFTISQCIPLLLGVISSFVYVHVQSTSTLGKNWKSYNYALHYKGRNFREKKIEIENEFLF